ncbi:MAG: hypothetical protein EOP67_16385 [Sphingomonas sp.]|nr:MAG: hypothetical protein EOP67_16385 [Sphingomonas sp.]
MGRPIDCNGRTTMFSHFFRTVLVAATLSGGAVIAAPASAAPTGVTVVAPEGGNVLLAQRYDRRDDRRYERGCSPRQALRKASRMGINRAGIVRDNRRAVVVDGRKRGRYISVSFAQERGCPVINVR